LSHAGAYVQADWGSIPDQPNIAAFSIYGPSPLTPEFQYFACVESEDDKAVKILSVRALIIKKP
jgi:hypothetical protein